MFRPLIFVLALAAVAASEGRFTEKIQNFMKEKVRCFYCKDNSGATVAEW